MQSYGAVWRLGAGAGLKKHDSELQVVPTTHPQIRVARFALVQYTKTGKIYQIDHKIYQIDHKIYQIEHKIYQIDHKIYQIDHKIYQIDHKIYQIDHKIY
jgi:septal ring factor EnvC (AmiA/AmiB activator)